MDPNQVEAPRGIWVEWAEDEGVRDLLKLAILCGAQSASLTLGSDTMVFEPAVAAPKGPPQLRLPVRLGQHEAALSLWSSSLDSQLAGAAALVVARLEGRFVELQELAAGRGFQDFFEHEVDLHCVASLDGMFLRLNDTWTRTLGWSLDQLKARPFLEFVHPDDLQRTVHELGALGDGARTLHFENRYAMADGGWKRLQWTAAPKVEQGVIYATARDVTAVRKIQGELARLSMALDRIVDLILLMDLRTLRILYANHGAVTATGYPLSQLMGATPYGLLERIDSDSYDDLIRPLIDGRVPVVDFETSIRRADGSSYRAAIVIQRVDGPNGSELVLVARDMSYRSEVDRMKREFVSTVSHELRTPLTSIRGSLRLIEAGVVGVVPPEMVNLVGVASRNVERLVRLINDILDLEKIEGGQMDLRREPIDPMVLATATMEALKATADEAGVSLVGRPCENRRSMSGDFDRLTQVLTNLISNAVKFSPPGSQVSVSCMTGRDRVRLSVTDAGPGIAEADHDRVFAKFQQLDQSDTRQKGGTGLGLAISKAIVEEHGGQIGLISAPGQGTTFWFEIDQAASPAPQAPKPSRRPPQRRRTTTSHRAVVLIVEDDEDVVRVLGLMLRARGIGFVAASSLARAQQLLADIRPDAVLLDLELPDGNGLQLLEHLGRERAVPVVVISGSDPVGRTFDYPLLMDWVAKPFDEGSIDTALRLALQEGRRDAGVVLVVEDDVSARTVIVEMLSQVGVHCLEAADGVTAIRLFREARPDLVVLDVGLPQMDGFSVVAEIRSGAGRDTPLIVYSGRDRQARNAIR